MQRRFKETNRRNETTESIDSKPSQLNILVEDQKTKTDVVTIFTTRNYILYFIGKLYNSIGNENNVRLHKLYEKLKYCFYILYSKTILRNIIIMIYLLTVVTLVRFMSCVQRLYIMLKKMVTALSRKLLSQKIYYNII